MSLIQVFLFWIDIMSVMFTSQYLHSLILNTIGNEHRDSWHSLLKLRTQLKLHFKSLGAQLALLLLT